MVPWQHEWVLSFVLMSGWLRRDCIQFASHRVNYTKFVPTLVAGPMHNEGLECRFQ